jgi:hypothetical protein
VDLKRLAGFVMEWEARGEIHPGEGVVVGYHEPAAVAGALRVGRTKGGQSLVEELVQDREWGVLRSYDNEEDACTFVFDRLAERSARAWDIPTWVPRCPKDGGRDETRRPDPSRW